MYCVTDSLDSEELLHSLHCYRISETNHRKINNIDYVLLISTVCVQLMLLSNPNTLKVFGGNFPLYTSQSLLLEDMSLLKEERTCIVMAEMPGM